MAIKTDSIAEYLGHVMGTSLQGNTVLSGYEKSVFQKILDTVDGDTAQQLKSTLAAPAGPMPQPSILPLQNRYAVYSNQKRMTDDGDDQPPDETKATAVQSENEAAHLTPEPEALGTLSRRFESGSKGTAAIGYDPKGGTSYGIYQIASRPGTMEDFLNFLESRNPEWAEQLRAAGPADTGSRGGAMPNAWREISTRDPEGFAAAQHAFVEANHYLPACRAISSRTGLDIRNSSEALRQVVWSTAVQHGATGAADIVEEALAAASAGNDTPTDLDLIRQIYTLRTDAATRGFSPNIQAALKNRFQSESQVALQMAKNETDLA